MTDTPPLHGIFPYLPSPVDECGRVDEQGLRHLIEHLIASGVHGLSPLGSTGEVMYLDTAQREEIVRITVDAAAGRVPVVPGVAAHATAAAAEQARRLADLGANGVVAIRLDYLPVPHAGVTSFFAGIAAATDLPVVLYSNPRLGAGLPLECLVELARHPTVQYLKDASGDTGHLLSVQNALGDRIKIFAASAHIPALVLQLGGVGWMAGPACVAPVAAVLLYRLHTEQRPHEAVQLQRALWPLNELFAQYGLAAFVKLALRDQGFDLGDPVAPQSPCPPEAARAFRRAMRAVDETVARLTAGTAP